MNDIRRAFFRAAGVVLLVLGAMTGAATCGDAWGRAHATGAP